MGKKPNFLLFILVAGKNKYYLSASNERGDITGSKWYFLLARKVSEYTDDFMKLIKLLIIYRIIKYLEKLEKNKKMKD